MYSRLRDISPHFVFGPQEDAHECYLNQIKMSDRVLGLINSKCSNFDNIASNQRNPMTNIFVELSKSTLNVHFVILKGKALLTNPFLK